MIRFIGARGMNRFAYSPKDDPFLRRDWAQPYGPEALADLAELVAAGAEAGVELTYCLSPGLTIRYSDDADADRVLDKLQSVAALGIRHFGLLVDDVPGRLQHDADIARYTSLAQGQATLANLVFRGLQARVSGATLIVCPTDYTGAVTSRTSRHSAGRSTPASRCCGPAVRSARRPVDAAEACLRAHDGSPPVSTGTTTRSTTSR